MPDRSIYCDPCGDLPHPIPTHVSVVIYERKWSDLLTRPLQMADPTTARTDGR